MSAVFLDLDGTLMDSRPGIISSLKKTFVEIGRADLAETDLTWMIGPRFDESFRAVGIEDVPAATDVYRKYYDGGSIFEASVFDGVPEMMDALRAAGHRLYLATAKPLIAAERITAHFGLSQRMIREFGPEADGTRSWKGDLLAYALEVTGEEARGSIMVGDRSHDVEAAKSVGMASIAVEWGYGGSEDWAGADRVISKPHELPEAIAALEGDRG